MSHQWAHRTHAHLFHTTIYGGIQLSSTQIDFNISGVAMDKEREYWIRTVSEEMNKTTLFFRTLEADGSQPEDGEGYKHFIYSFAEDVTDKIMGICSNSLPNLFSFVYAAMSVLLYRYSNEKYIVIETPVLRQEDAARLFNRKLPLIASALQNHSFKEWLLSARNVIKEAYENGNYPIHLIYALAGNSTADCPLTDCLLALEGLHNTKNLQELQNEVIIRVSVENRHLCLNIAYVPQWYGASQIGHFCEHLNTFIVSALAQMQTNIREIAFIGEQELQKLLWDFNDTDAVYVRPPTIHRCFEEQVGKTPNDIALVFEDEKLTYAELNEKSNRLAWILRGKGVGPNRIVGLIMERSAEMIIGLLAVLKAGGAYLPIDPDYPLDRVEYMLETSETKLLLTNCDLDNTARKPYEVLDVRSLSELGSNATNVPEFDNGNDLAYVIYTSGSTGRPKGVMVEHSQVINFAQGMVTKLGLDKYSSFLSLTTISFDIFVFETIVPLMCGMKVVLTSKGEDMNGETLRKTIDRNGADIMQTTPSRLLLLLHDDAFVKALNNVKAVLCGGEPLPPIVVAKLTQYEELKLFNMYGPTETTVWSLVKEITDPVSNLVGKPIANTRVYILDETDRMVPLGAPGELCISGRGVARGYLYQEALTKSKFIANPFVPGEKMYKTGDFARWRSDGNVEFCGRKDNQVKIRGYRIELGEIENCMLEIDGMKDAKVVDKEHDGTKYLCAFYVAGKTYAASALRDTLRVHLPDYMVPSYFARLDAMPLTHNGKTNVLRLRELKMDHHNAFVEPGTADEAFLLQELKPLLHMENIGVTDNIFDLGANSLNMMRFIQRIQGKYAIEFADVVQHPTIREIAKVAVPRTTDIRTLLRNLKESILDRNFVDSEPEQEATENQISEYRSRYNQIYSDLDLTQVSLYDNVLLTGATGYLGIYLLRDLLNKTSARITMIIRGRNPDEAEDKLHSQFKFYFSEGLVRYMDRIRIYQGDLSEDKLGLNSQEYEELSESVTCILNSAADVRHYGLYENFYRANVQSVENLLELCGHGVEKYFCHISTTSVSNGYVENMHRMLYTEFQGILGQQFENDYVATKAEAEKRVFEARRRGIASTIFRVGNLVFNSKTGQCQKNVESNAFYQRIKSFLSLQRVPDLPGPNLEFSYVDRVSDAIVLLFNRVALQNEVFHINNPFSIDHRAFAAYLREAGCEVNTMNLEALVDYLSKNYDHPECKEAIDILFIHSNFLDPGKKTPVLFSSEKTIFILERLGFCWERVNAGHVRRMLQYGIETGFFPKERLYDGVLSLIQTSR